jgi:flagellar motor switch protein FliM
MAASGSRVLEKKVGNRRVGRSPLPDIELIGENFGVVLEDRLRPLLKTIVGAFVVDCEITRLSDVVEDIPVPAMLGIVGLEESDNSALINLSSELVYHLVDMRMGGDSASAPVPTTRSFTGIDVQLCMDVFDAILASFTKAIEDSLGVPLGEKLRVIGAKQDVNTVRIAPKTADVLLLKISLDIGEAARSGEFDLIAPLAILDIFKAATTYGQEPRPPSPNDLWNKQMRRSAAVSAIELHAVIHRFRMALMEAQALSVGDVLPLPGSCLRDASLVLALGQREESVIAQGRIGGYNDTKVIKLAEPPRTEIGEALTGLVDGS